MTGFRRLPPWAGKKVSCLLPTLLVYLSVLAASGPLVGCTALLTSTVVQPAVANLQQQTDLHLVCEGAPAYLLLLDSMLVSAPDNEQLLLTATQSTCAYASALTECGGEPTRVAEIVRRARGYGQRLFRHHLPEAVDGGDLAAGLAHLRKKQVPQVFWATSAWLMWVERSGGSPAALADLVAIEAIMVRLLELDETYQNGAIHLFFGVYHASRPAMLGGRPEVARRHFERALELSQRTFLPVQTAFAETYGRMTMNVNLHNQLLEEVLAFPIETVPEQAFSNQLARARAARLLAENYFAD